MSELWDFSTETDTIRARKTLYNFPHFQAKQQWTLEKIPKKALQFGANVLK